MRSPSALAAVLFVSAVLQLASASVGHDAGAEKPSVPFTVFGYLPEYRLQGFDYEAAFQTGLTHLIYFSVEVDPRKHVPTALDRLPSMRQARQARAAADRVGGKLLLGFGGNSRSDGFSEMVASPERRMRFIHALNDLLVRFKFDGVDYNWEYPANAHEWRLWGMLLKESKRHLLGSDNIVTFTMYQDPKHAAVIRQFDLLEHADYVHCMSYDQPGQHSTMEFAKEGVEMALKKLGDKSKAAQFTLGVPFYARDTRTGTPKTYAELAPQLKSKKIDLHDTFYFNSVQTIYQKTRLAMDAGLGGVMIWELGQDVQPLSGPKALMWGIKEAVTGKSRKELVEAGRATKEAEAEAEARAAEEGARVAEEEARVAEKREMDALDHGEL